MKNPVPVIVLAQLFGTSLWFSANSAADDLIRAWGIAPAAIGRDMEALGNQIEREAGVADARIRSLIDEAIARGLAQPVKRR